MKSFFVLILTSFNVCYSQKLIYQDIVKGGVNIVGTSTGLFNSGLIDLEYNIPIGSTIKKIFFTATAIKNDNYFPPICSFILNDSIFEINVENEQLIQVEENFPSSSIDGHLILIKDITERVTLIDDSLHLDWYTNLSPPIGCPACYWNAPQFIIIFENPSFSNFTLQLYLNDVINQNSSFNHYEFSNAINFNKDIGFGIQCDRIGGNEDDGYDFFIETIPVGSCNGIDNEIFYSGASTNYYYGNDSIKAIYDDIEDGFILSDYNFVGSDMLINLNLYTPTINNGFDFYYNYLQFTTVPHNYFISTAISYSTDCEVINSLVSNDTIICKGETIQLSANGGVNYEWFPQTDLSCTNCPNPIFSGDSSQLYTVQIWANDTCSVVRPVMVKVRQQPQTTSYFQSNSLCGDSTATINWQNIGTNEYSLDNLTFQNSGIFNSVNSGNHTLTIKDTFGCEFDTLISIASFINVNSNFTATPTTGEKPLLVQLSELNTNDDGYWWNINGIVYPSTLNEFNFINTGTYQINLIAFQNDSTCTDTSSVTIVVYNDLTLTIPNVITANNDGVNDAFEIIGLENFPNNEIYIFNRWGNEVFHMVNYDNSWKGECKNGFGKKDELPTATYYYILNAEGIESVHGFIWLQR